MTGSPRPYDARAMATNPHLVPAFREPDEANLTDAEFEALMQTADPAWIVSRYEDDEPLADVLDAFEQGMALVTAPSRGA